MRRVFIKLVTNIPLVSLVIFSFFFFYILPKAFSEHYKSEKIFESKSENIESVISNKPSYIRTPDSVKAIYMTSWVASQNNMRLELAKLIDETELNAVVIDIKDYSGKIVFEIDSPELKKYGSEEVRIRDLREFIEVLHNKGIYVIARLAVFQDAYFVNFRPDLAVKTKNGTKIWKDLKGLSWIDPNSQEYWDYIILLSKEAHKIGFDEINFDYVRFPSDGDMLDISYPLSSTSPKATIMKNFFEYLNTELDESGLFAIGEESLGGKTSADLFGMVTTSNNDMGIGQVLEIALPYFDYVSPMVYPSHYPLNFEGFKDPESYPYEIINFSLKSAIDRAVKASSTPQKIRPWLQDFGLRVKYGQREVKAQIKAVNDLGLTSWMLWSPSNKYTKDAFERI